MNFIRLIALLLCITVSVETSSNRTFAMIKPHAVQEKKTEEILKMINAAGFLIVSMKKSP